MRSLRWSRVGVLHVALLASCGSQPRVPALASSAPATITVWVEPGGLGDPERFVATLPTKDDAFVQDGYRFTVSPDRRTVEWAADRFASPVVLAAPATGGWVFAAADGAVMRADTFLGPLSRLGNLPAAAVTPFSGRGIAAVITSDGEVFATDGQRPVARLVLPGDARAVAGAFATATHGAVITEGGGLLATADGGATWQRIALGNEAAWRLDLAGETLVVTTSGGVHVVRADATLGDLPPGLTADTGSSVLPPASFHRDGAARWLSPADDLVVSLSKWARFPESARFRSDLLIESDGRALLPDVGELVAFQLDTGRRHDPPPASLPASRGCALLSWGARRVLVCDEEDEPWPLQIGSPGSAFEPLPGTIARDPYDLAFSSDGDHAARLGSCAGTGASDRPRRHRSLCAYRRDGAARAIALDFEADVVAEVRGTNAIVFGEAADGSTIVALVDLGSGTTMRLAAPGVTIETLGFAGSQTLAGLASVDGDGDDDAWVMVKAGLDGRFATHGLPDGAQSVGFLDARRGVAAGAVLSELWATSDGGATWTAAPSTIAGASSHIPLSDRGEPLITCEADGCLVGRAARVRWGAATATGHIFANERAFATAPAELVDPMDRSLSLHDDCVLEAAAATVAAPLPPVPGAPTRVTSLDLGERRGRLVEDGGLARLAWRVDPTSDRVLETSPTRLEGTSVDATIDLVAADHRLALVTRCGDGLRRECEVLRAEPGKPLKVVARLDELAHPPNLEDRAIGWLGPDGSAAVLFASHPTGIADGVVMPKLDVMLAFGPDGALRGRRAFTWTASPGMHSGLAVRAGVVGYFARGPATGGATHIFGPGGPAPDPSLARLDEALPACGAGPGSDDRRILFLRSRPVGLELENASAGVLTLETGAAGPCVRSFETSSRDAADEPTVGPEAVSLVARGGAWHASVSRRDGLHAATCAKPSP